MQDSRIKKGASASGVATALGLFAAAGGVVCVALLTEWTISIRRFALPQWTLYVVAAGLALVGLAMFAFSTSVEKCATCGKELDCEDAYFPLDMEAQVTAAVQAVDVGVLHTIPMVPKDQMKMDLRISVCPNGHVGVVELKKWQDFRPHDILPERAVDGPVVMSLAQLAQQHADFRGDD